MRRELDGAQQLGACGRQIPLLAMQRRRGAERGGGVGFGRVLRGQQLECARCVAGGMQRQRERTARIPALRFERDGALEQAHRFLRSLTLGRNGSQLAKRLSILGRERQRSA